MPSYQQSSFIEEAVRSALDQQGVTTELIVLDPGSTDGTRELLLSLKEEYGDRLVLHFAPDSGQADAVNRGLAMARGRVMGWLNSDDRLRPGALSCVTNLLDSDQPRWLYGRCGIIDSGGKPVGAMVSRYKELRGRSFSIHKLVTENFIPQMAVFWNTSIWERSGGLDPNRHLDMDYDLWLRYAQISTPMVLTERLADFRVHGAGKSSLRTIEMLDMAFETARRHSERLGRRGQWALFIHRLFRLRNKMAFRVFSLMMKKTPDRTL